MTALSPQPASLSPGSPGHDSRVRLRVLRPHTREEARAINGAPPPAPPEIRAMRRMVDSHGRTIRDLRLSLTDRCNFRCVYCMEPDVRFAPRDNLLSADELVRLALVAESLGVRKIRLTGGEPTMNPDLLQIIGEIRRRSALEIAIITNGWRVSRDDLRAWKRAGLDRVTISIDTLRSDRFAAITRSPASPDDVIAAAEWAVAEGLTPVKLNAVLIRGHNEDEAADLAALARRLNAEMRFIEYMPLDSAHSWNASRMVPASETRRAIERRFPLVALDHDDPSRTARVFRFADGAPGRVGFIAPVTSPFCGACNRLRITADGQVRPCLFSTREWDVRAPLRSGASDEQLAELLIDATWTKQPGHGISAANFEQPDRPMSAIGG